MTCELTSFLIDAGELLQHVSRIVTKPHEAARKRIEAANRMKWSKLE
ncbi:hypothetical protein FYK61_10970 [Xanthomonas citri]|nr:hypothetical protein [Xanthomonas citri]MBE2321229.1 hypothetical protein [Solirubrobacter deserti]QOY21883.1 hypothetical protein FYK61_10970 [Xanthomonas citri]QQK68025.1 hypothetical protein G3566_10950 [Xanthomonas citri]